MSVMAHCNAIFLDPVTFVMSVMDHCKAIFLDPVTFVVFVAHSLLPFN